MSIWYGGPLEEQVSQSHVCWVHWKWVIRGWLLGVNQLSNNVLIRKGWHGMVVASPPISCQYENLANSPQGRPHCWTERKCFFSKDRLCRACVEENMHDSPHPIKAFISSKRILELLHVDLFGVVHEDSLGGKKYCLVIVDDYSRYTWVYFFKHKSETQQTFIDFTTQIQHQHNHY